MIVLFSAKGARGRSWFAPQKRNGALSLPNVLHDQKVKFKIDINADEPFRAETTIRVTKAIKKMKLKNKVTNRTILYVLIEEFF